jgi:hypothetical protein
VLVSKRSAKEELLQALLFTDHRIWGIVIFKAPIVFRGAAFKHKSVNSAVTIIRAPANTSFTLVYLDQAKPQTLNTSLTQAYLDKARPDLV